MGQGARVRRRSLLGGAAASAAVAAVGTPLLWLSACRNAPELGYDGGWLGADPLRGHRLREGLPASAAAGTQARRRHAVKEVGENKYQCPIVMENR